MATAYHMYRAKKLFEKQGLIIIPYKVDFIITENSKKNLMEILPSAGNLELTKTGIREFI